MGLKPFWLKLQPCGRPKNIALSCLRDQCSLTRRPAMGLGALHHHLLEFCAAAFCASQGFVEAFELALGLVLVRALWVDQLHDVVPFLACASLAPSLANYGCSVSVV